ncbi:NUDIX domain-containing protein [Hoyosella subflava]|uniref:MutT/nudix family protein n=1 Tax=Hoyosella subflava (strain DSM 45089 / JCM 17490 / NBRC 109087 / DQS3-9A1) TaxID=443218 RepID=F6EI32_HOYSD|nr:NUDIX hydrolase [Hoyosella subflava]AEF39981.1 MutT/nudix family protein [Hoyosella subflava DQS3-9A1]
MTEPGSHEFSTSASRLAYDGAVIALRVDDVVMPGGRSAVREVIEHYGAVAIVAIDDEDRIAFVEQYRHPLGARLLELPAGLLDEPGESPLRAAERELVEEAGIAADSWKLLVDVAVSPGMTDEVVRVFLAQDLRETARPEAEHEEADMRILRVPLADAVKMALRGEISNATSVAGVLALHAARAAGTDLREPDAPWPLRPSALARRRHGDGE